MQKIQFQHREYNVNTENTILAIVKKKYLLHYNPIPINCNIPMKGVGGARTTDLLNIEQMH